MTQQWLFVLGCSTCVSLCLTVRGKEKKAAGGTASPDWGPDGFTSKQNYWAHPLPLCQFGTVTGLKPHDQTTSVSMAIHPLVHVLLLVFYIFFFASYPPYFNVLCYMFNDDTDEGPKQKRASLTIQLFFYTTGVGGANTTDILLYVCVLCRRSRQWWWCWATATD